MHWYLYPAVIAAGILCGFINTLAGSGSLITLPLLIFLGLPATVANGTNRVAILLQNIVGARGFQSHGLLDLRQALWLAAPAAIGAIVGAHIAVNLNDAAMKRAIGIIMIIMLVVCWSIPNAGWKDVAGRFGSAPDGPSWASFSSSGSMVASSRPASA
ncbi:MAG: sulfite exporter TauE/SafE family protein [Anaerolineae bacterium]|nr:sulfite exporter TauE/SafE family protein [Anaerolineae bacterium]